MDTLPRGAEPRTCQYAKGRMGEGKAPSPERYQWPSARMPSVASTQLENVPLLPYSCEEEQGMPTRRLGPLPSALTAADTWYSSIWG